MSPYSEEALINKFLAQLRGPSAPWPIAGVQTEFDYRRGRTDVVAVSAEGEVVAFEAKVARWKTALWQAYRNTCFAHHTYVVLPAEQAMHAQQHRAEFERLGVGLCAVEAEAVIVLIESETFAPLQPWLTLQATERIAAGAASEHAAAK
jgi:hypothetical protein